MFLGSFVFCCLFIAGAVDCMEILEERSLFREFMKYPLNIPEKDLDLQVLSLHLRPSSRNKSKRNGLGKVEQSPRSGETIQLSGRRKDMVTTQAKPETSYKVPQSKIQQEHLEYEELGGKHFKSKGRSKNSKRPRRPAKLREPKLEREEGERYKEVKHKKLRSRRIKLFTRSRRKKQQNGKRQSISWTVKPTNEEVQRRAISQNWGDGGHLPLASMIDGKVLSDKVPVTYNQLEGENYYNTQQVDVFQKEDEKQNPVIWDGSREPLDYSRHRKLKFFSESERNVTYKEPSLTEDHLKEMESSVKTIANKPFYYIPNGGAEHSSVIVLPTRNGVRDSELPQDSPLWRMVVPIADVPIIDIYSDTIQPVETHTRHHEADHQTHLLSHGDILTQAEGSGIYNSMALEHDDKIVTVTPTKRRVQMVQETQGFLMPKPTETLQQSSDNTSTSSNSKNTEVPRVTGSEELLNGIFSSLEATKNHNPGPLYCKPGYKEYDGVCKSQCDIDGIYCGDRGQCVIVETIGAMCRCQRMNSLCYGGECCRSSLTIFQLVCVVGGCCVLLSVFLGALPYLIRRMDIKAISKSVRTRLWISTLMPRSNSTSSSQSADFTVCSDYESLSDHSTFHCTKQMARNSTMWQCERTRL